MFALAGYLDNVTKFSENAYNHSWVENRDSSKVYDTTWQMVCDKAAYYSVFGARCTSRLEISEFIKKNGHLIDVTVRDRNYYIENKNSFVTKNGLVHSVKKKEEKRIVSPTTTIEEKLYSQQVINDLPPIVEEEQDEKK